MDVRITKRANRCFFGCEKSRKRSGFVIYSYLKDGTLTAVKRDVKFSTKVCEWGIIVDRRFSEGVPSLSKTVYKRGWTSGWSLRGLKFYSIPPFHLGQSTYIRRLRLPLTDIDRILKRYVLRAQKRKALQTIQGASQSTYAVFAQLKHELIVL